MPYMTPWGEERPTKKELKEGTEMTMRLMGVEPSTLEQELKPGDIVDTPNGSGQVHKVIGRLIVQVEHDYSYLVDYPITKVRKS